MDDNAPTINLEQPVLFEWSDTSSGGVELFPAVWAAGEGLVAPELEIRKVAFERLVALDAPRISPLIAYLLATRISEPDLPLRAKIVHTLGELFLINQQGKTAPELVRRFVIATLKQMRIRLLFSLLEVSVFDPTSEADIARLLNFCPYAGLHLVDILADRKVILTLRLKAAQFIGLVGYLNAIPNLERLATRLEARLSGQQAMSFAPPASSDESELLPVVLATLSALKVA